MSGDEPNDLSDRSIEAILKSSGRRPTVPRDRFERVRSIVRTEWQSVAARRSRSRRLFGWSLALAAAVALVAVGLGIRRAPVIAPPQGSSVLVERAVGGTSLPRPGSAVPWTTTVATVSGERLALRAPTGHSLRLDAGCRLRVISDRVFQLDRGRLYVDVPGPAHAPHESIEIRTRLGRIEDTGTQFAVSLEAESLAVRVREGAVTLRSGDDAAEAKAGELMRLDGAGRIHRAADPSPGDDWGWIEAIAPAMRIEGRSLGEFLEWIARERGVALRYTGAGVAERAPGISLRGSIEGMTLDEATTSVLATCGLSHRWENGALVVGEFGGSAPAKADSTHSR